MVLPPKAKRSADFHLRSAGETIDMRQLNVEDLPDEVQCELGCYQNVLDAVLSSKGFVTQNMGSPRGSPVYYG